MKEVAGGPDGRPSTSCPPDPSRHDPEAPPSPLGEELFCGAWAPLPLAPLAGAVAGSGGPRSDVVKCGYLGRQGRGHRRYFVLRAGSHTGPSRLEWHKDQDTFTAAAHKPASRAALFSGSKERVIYLRCCLGVSRTRGSHRGHTVALYTKDQTVELATEDEQEQEEWYAAIKGLMEEQAEEEQAEEEDDGYCTLPPAAAFKQVWPVTVKSRGASGCRTLAGENLLCLTATALILIRVGGGGGDLPSVTIPLLSVRRFGHMDSSFFLELGRSAPGGPGEIWMEARERGPPARHVHEAVREAVRALRVLPDFSRSLSYNRIPSRVALVSKRCRTKHGDKMGDTQSGPDQPGPSSSDLSPGRDRSMSWEEEEEEEEERGEGPGEGPGYMVMSPQVSHTQDDYVTMTSPQRPSSSSSFSSSTFDSDSPLDSPPHHIHEPLWPSSGVPPQMTTSSPAPRRERGPPPPPAPPGGVTDGLKPLLGTPEPPGRRSWLSCCLPSCLCPDCF